jgi:hypothetical protein
MPQHSTANRYYVYAYLRSETSVHGEIGSPYYFGKGKNKRAFTRSHRLLPNDDRFILILRDGLTEEEAFNWERMLIGEFGRVDLDTGCLRNLTDGGDGTSNPTPATKAKWKAARKGSGNSFFGKRHSDKAKQQNSLWHKGRAPWNKGTTGIMFPNGRTFSDDHRNNISKAKKGMPQPHTSLRNKTLKATCPHCNTVGQKTAMKRWHFDHCRIKGEK